MTVFICPSQELPAEKVRQIVRDAGCDWPEDDSRESRLWRFNVRRIVNAAWHRGFADHAAAQPAATSETVNVIWMPEFDGLLDHIYEHGTAAEGVIEKANAFARAVIARYAPELEAQLEAVGAGGVSGPLMGIAAPPTAQAEGWTKLPGTLPKPGTPVLLDIGKKYPIRAMWAAKHTVPAADDDTDWGEYDEATEEYWCPEGWYEWNQNEDNHWRVTETPRAWMPLPPTSAEGVEHG